MELISVSHEINEENSASGLLKAKNKWLTNGYKQSIVLKCNGLFETIEIVSQNVATIVVKVSDDNESFVELADLQVCLTIPQSQRWKKGDDPKTTKSVKADFRKHVGQKMVVCKNRISTTF